MHICVEHVHGKSYDRMELKDTTPSFGTPSKKEIAVGAGGVGVGTILLSVSHPECRNDDIALYYDK